MDSGRSRVPSVIFCDRRAEAGINNHVIGENSIMSNEVVGYTAAEKQVARQARQYLKEHGICLTWQFREEYPPSKEVEEFLWAMESDFFDVDEAECVVLERAIDTIEMEWLDDEKGEDIGPELLRSAVTAQVPN